MPARHTQQKRWEPGGGWLDKKQRELKVRKARNENENAGWRHSGRKGLRPSPGSDVGRRVHQEKLVSVIAEVRGGGGDRHPNSESISEPTSPMSRLLVHTSSPWPRSCIRRIVTESSRLE
jgi:hypothetical protein